MSEKKLLDDCFLHDRKRMLHEEALALLRDRVRPVAGIEILPLSRAAGRILATPAVARHAVPAHTNAAVDGYAFAFHDYDATMGSIMPVMGRAAAGHPLAGPVEPRSAVRILTGAVVPAGLDTTVMQEDVEILEPAPGQQLVHVPAGLKARANVRQAGEDVKAGETLFQPGHVIRPQDLAALASIGLGEVPCFKRLRVAIISSGDEIIEPGSRPLEPGEVYDANQPMLSALAALAGAETKALGVLPDRAEEVRRHLLQAAGEFDVIMTTGGASAGDEDHMSGALNAIGRRHMWQLAIKPGRPMMFGQIGDTVMVGLPGNPVAVFVCYLMYVFPTLRRLGGAAWSEPRRFRLPASFSLPKRKTGRREFWRGMLVEGPNGLSVDKFARDGSGLISGLRAADGLIDIPEDIADVQPGDALAFIPFSEFGILLR